MKNFIINAFSGLCFIAVFSVHQAAAQGNGKSVLAYFSGRAAALDSVDANQFSHIIYCFGHLKGNRISIRNVNDTLVISKMVAMKNTNPRLKVLLSLGGWGGCETCSDVFSTKAGRKEFAASVKQMIDYFGADGIDLDWEYPTVKGFPGHKYADYDKANFTSLVGRLRKTLGREHVITFAAGGYQEYLDHAVDWKKVMKKVDFVNLMTYDLVNGNSTVTGHHTPLYSAPGHIESVDNCVQFLIRQGVDPLKMIVGSAFYARTWENVENINNGRYQSGKFKSFVPFKTFPKQLSQDSGFVYFWDDTASAPYAYNAAKKTYATFDDKRSITLKTEYVLKHNLGGIMFWELALDQAPDGLLQRITQTLKDAADKR